MIAQRTAQLSYEWYRKPKGEFLRGVVAGYAMAVYHHGNLYGPAAPPSDRLMGEVETPRQRRTALEDTQLEGNVIATGLSPELETIALALRRVAGTLARTRGSIAVLLYLQENDVTHLNELGRRVELAGADLIRVLARLLADRLVLVENEMVLLSRFGQEVADRLDKRATQVREG